MAAGAVAVEERDLGLNAAAARIVQEMIEERERLALTVAQLDNGTLVVDAGAGAAGSLEGGVRFARACLGGLGRVELTHVNVGDMWLPAVSVAVDHPAISCLGSQYAGWQIKGASLFALGSGPARALARREKIFEHLRYAESANDAVLLLECNSWPDTAVAAEIATACGVRAERLALVVARTASLAGSVQIAARVVETALHKLHTLGYDVLQIVAGMGTCPLAPIARSDTRAIGRTNDCVLYGGSVFLTARGGDAEIEAIVEHVPSSASRDYGTPFYDTFKRYDNDFYKIDPALFSPAEIWITNMATGNTFHAGALNPEVLRTSLFARG